jgi:hypothetical protein
MRKLLHILIAFAAISIVACTKHIPESIPQYPDTPRSYIFFEPSVYETVESKAALVSGDKLPADAGTAFGILGYYGSTSLFASAYTDGIAKVYRPEGSSDEQRLPFVYDNLVFWYDQTTQHHFYAFYPYSNNANGTPLTINPNSGKPYIVYTQPTSNNAAMVDLMTASKSTSQCNEVELVFDHRLWALDVVITNAQTEGLNSSDQVITTPTITIKNVSVTVENFPTGARIYLDKEYKEAEISTPGIVLNTEKTSQASTYTINAESSGDVLANSGTTASKRYGSFLYLPVSAKVFKYSLSITYLDSRGVQETFTTGAAKVLDKAFDAGKKYTLTVTKTNDTFVVGTLSPSAWTDHPDINHEFN